MIQSMRYTCLFILLFTGMLTKLSAQDNGQKWKVAVFAPVYLDSAFDQHGNYKLTSNTLPRYMLPGLDFYNGVMLAIDSLNAEKAPIDVMIYDTRSESGNILEVVKDSALREVSLIIASFSNRTEIQPLANLALEYGIPLISATYPNDGGIRENPYLAIVNPTLRTHLEAVYKYLQRTYPNSNLTMFRRKGGVEDLIQSVFADMARMPNAGTPLRIKTVELTDSFTTSQVASMLDSTRQNIVIAGSLNEAFGTNLVKSLSELKRFRSIAIGMPTWDALRGVDRSVEIVYTTPYHFVRTEGLGLELTNKYRDIYAGRPSDMVFKGFESMYHFTKLLIKNKGKLIGNLSEKSFHLFNEFNFQPVAPYTKENGAVDYLENKKLYFIRKQDGLIRSVN